MKNSPFAAARAFLKFAVFQCFLVLIPGCQGEHGGAQRDAEDDPRRPLPAEPCEEVGANGPVGVTYVSGNRLKLKKVSYNVHQGEAIVEGDIVLGPIELAERAKTAVEQKLGDDLGTKGIVISDLGRRWPDKKVFYTVDKGLPKQERVTAAIAHWEAKTEIRFVKRTNQRNYVTFRKGDGCSSSVGMKGGQQFITLSDGCSTGNVIHEIGHAVGLFHEQSREDRDKFVEIKWGNVQEGKKSQFSQHIHDGDDVRIYDFKSVMHYPSNAFAKDRSKPTIVTKPPEQPIGQRDGLSDTDVATVRKIYP